ncbi:MAG: hypothetical protein BGO67_11735 [Alphaproteobacteria bacterium 41-28]|nr:MAG: hypothetical protein BGO67_11735 [Alphaproteobacteria bacterium 41-28]
MPSKEATRALEDILDNILLAYSFVKNIIFPFPVSSLARKVLPSEAGISFSWPRIFLRYPVIKMVRDSLLKNRSSAKKWLMFSFGKQSISCQG